MRIRWVFSCVFLSCGPFIAASQVSQDEGPATEVESPLIRLTPAKVTLWADKVAYTTGEQMSLYLTTDPMGDTNEYTEFVYLQDRETNVRQYLPAKKRTVTLSSTVVDSRGMAPDSFVAEAIPARTKQHFWRGGVPEPGLWQWVIEIRSADTTQVIKRAYAKFAVSRISPIVFGSGGTDTEISTDATWTNNHVYEIRHQVFVNSEATLTIEPGTVILAKGQNAALIVEEGGKIMAEGNRKFPIVMTCADRVGERAPGCWGGLVVLGNAPVTSGAGSAEGVTPSTRPTYGGDDSGDSSGVLRYVRVEFAGGGEDEEDDESRLNAFGFHGVGSGTVIDHVQAHESGDDGIEFSGGTADCLYCVSSGSRDDSLGWAFGWRGTAQFVFIHQGQDGDNGIEADNDLGGFSRRPRSHPTLYNITMIGGLAQAADASSGHGVAVATGSALTARNLIVAGFGVDGLNVQDTSTRLFANGTSSIKNWILYANFNASGDAQITSDPSGVAGYVEYLDTHPLLINVRYEANPDPRPVLGSPVLKVGAAAVPPSNGTLDTSAQYIGAFAGENWLEEWTFFGPESEYSRP